MAPAFDSTVTSPNSCFYFLDARLLSRFPAFFAGAAFFFAGAGRGGAAFFAGFFTVVAILPP